MWEILIADLLLIVLLGAALALMKHPDGLLTAKEWALCSLGVYLFSCGVLVVIVLLERAILRGWLGGDVKVAEKVSGAFSIGLGALAVAMLRRRSNRRAYRAAAAAGSQTKMSKAADRGHARSAATPLDSVDALLLRAEQNIQRRRTSLPTNFANERFEYAVWNCDRALLSHLEKLALLHRARNDKVGAQAELTAAVAFLAHTEDAITKGHAVGDNLRAFINAGNLAHAVLITLLANDWPRSQRLAHAVQLPCLQQQGRDNPSSNLREEVASMLAAVVIDDRRWFDVLRGGYHTNREFSYFDRTYFNYDELMLQILERDDAGLNTALVNQEESFLARATDAGVDLSSCLQAGPKYNALVFDVWAVALASLARKKGISVTHSSEIIPTADFLPT